MKNLLRVLSIAAMMLCGGSLLAEAQTQWPTPTAGIPAGGGTAMWLNSSGQSVPVSAANPFPISGTFWQVTQPVSLAAVPLPPGFSVNNITTSTTTVVKSGAGVLHGVTINLKGTVASTVTIYDSLTGSGTKIGTVDSLTLSGAFFYDAAFATGLTVVTTGTAAPDVSITYR
jgi:hypothetical protein